MKCPTCKGTGTIVQVRDKVSQLAYSFGRENGFTGHRIVTKGDRKNGRIEFKNKNCVTVYTMVLTIKHQLTMESEYTNKIDMSIVKGEMIIKLKKY